MFWFSFCLLIYDCFCFAFSVRMASFRLCSTLKCKNRLPDFKYDRHTKCSFCVGQTCDFGLRCDECANWPDDVFKAFVKHRKRLEVDRRRKAKSRQKSKTVDVSVSATCTQAVKETSSGRPKQSSRSVHNISSSENSGKNSAPKSTLIIDDVSLDLLTSPDSVHLSPSRVPKSLPHTPTAAPPTPSSGQAITLSSAQFSFLVASIKDLKSNQSVMHENLNALMAARSDQVHSASVVPPGQASGPRPAEVLGCDPQSTDVLCAQVAGGSVSGGEPPSVGTYPSGLESDPVRSRKRVRESKDSKARAKRSRAPSSRVSPTRSVALSSGSSVDLSVSITGLCPPGLDRAEDRDSSRVNVNVQMLGHESNVRSESLNIRNARSDSVLNIDCPRQEGRVPQPSSVISTPASKGRFNESMELALRRICLEYAHAGPIVQQQKMREHLNSVDPLNVSYISSRISSPPQVGKEQEGLGLVSVLPASSRKVEVQPSGERLKESVVQEEIASNSQDHVPIGRVLSPAVVVSEAQNFVTPTGVIPLGRSDLSFPKPSASSTPLHIRRGLALANLNVTPQVDSRPAKLALDQAFGSRPSSVSDAHVRKVSSVVQTADVPSTVVQSVRSRVATPSVQLVQAAHQADDVRPSLVPPVIGEESGPVFFNEGAASVVGGTASRHSIVREGANDSIVPSQIVPTQIVPTQAESFERTDGSALCSNSVVADNSGEEGQAGPSAEGARALHEALETVKSFKGDPLVSKLLIQSLINDGEEDNLFADLSYASTYRKLTAKIFDKYDQEDYGKVIDDNTPYQDGHEGQKPKAKKLKLNKAVRGKLEKLDQALLHKKDQVKPSASFPAFMNMNSARAYIAGDGPDTLVTWATKNALKGILDGQRAKFLEKSKVSFSNADLEVIIKSVFRELEIWSFTTSGLDVLADCFKDLKERLPEKDQYLADEYGSYIKCLDKAGRHGIGEAAHAFANLVLRKREHVLSFASKTIDPCQKADILFSPISSFKLFDNALVREQVKEIRQSSESAAIVNVVRPKAKFFPYYNPSPLQVPRGGGRGRRGYRDQKQSNKSRDYWRRRDRFVRQARRFQ